MKTHRVSALSPWLALCAALALPLDLSAQAAMAMRKKPITQDTYDIWRVIQGSSLSPDGRWAAFTSDESGRQEVFVRRFPVADAGGVWKLSSGGGYRARWSGDGRTIYYQTVDNKLVRAVRVTPGPKFVVGPSETIMTVSALGNAWDVDRQTGRLVVSEPVSAARARIVVMQHRLDDFRRRAATPPGRSRSSASSIRCERSQYGEADVKRRPGQALSSSRVAYCPGSTTTTRMPNGWTSKWSASEMASSACLLAE